MRPLLAWFRAHRFVTGCLCVVLILWGAHVSLNWAAERGWRQYCDEARRHGVKLTLAEFAAPEIPEAENFAMLPMFKAALAATSGDTPNPFRLPPSGNPPSGGDLVKGTPIDWNAWQQYCKSSGLIEDTTGDSIADVLRGLDRYRPAIEEWRQWKERPRSRFPLNANIDPLLIRFPPFGIPQGAAQICGWRMRAYLAQHDSPAALEDFRDTLQAYRALQEEPMLIAGLVRMAVLAVASARVGDGLAGHSWTEADLRALDAELGRVRILEDYRLALSSERGFANAIYERHFLTAGPMKIATHYSAERSVTAGRPPGLSYGDLFVGFMMTKRQVRANQLRHNRYIDELLARVGSDAQSLDLDRPTPSEATVGEDILSRWRYVLFNASPPKFDTIEKRYVRMQTQIHLTRLAIALERYHLAHGTFPSALEDLLPAFLDAPLPDPWSGQPMKYRRTKGDSYLLYSVGENRKDDGGAIDQTQNEAHQRDGIWFYAPP